MAQLGQPAPSTQNNTLGLVSLILGIVSIPLACCFFLGLPLGLGAAVLGYLGKQKAEQGQASNRGQALAGLICGVVGAGIAVLLIILNVVFRTMDILPTLPNS